MVKYAPFEKRGLEPCSKSFAKEENIINIRNNDERWLWDAILYFLDRLVDFHRHANRANFTQKFFLAQRPG